VHVAGTGAELAAANVEQDDLGANLVDRGLALRGRSIKLASK
jgi:hypothetical protein